MPSLRRRLIEKVGRLPIGVLLLGESGTGKEIVARELHRASGRAAFVAVNCGAIPENLLESELMGSVKGAFTGANHDRRGLIEEADGGTLFLDEIGELPLSLQVKLNRFLEEGEVRRVGENHPRNVDVRLIAATHRNLEAMVQAGTFRADLYYRLRVVQIHLPPLRERISDLPLLAARFLHAAAIEAGVERVEVGVRDRPELEGEHGGLAGEGSYRGEAVLAPGSPDHGGLYI